jgi:Na+-transporting NADH:ubiquinone oxidoreductase subunit NqrE
VCVCVSGGGEEDECVRACVCLFVFFLLCLCVYVCVCVRARTCVPLCVCARARMCACVEKHFYAFIIKETANNFLPKFAQVQKGYTKFIYTIMVMMSLSQISWVFCCFFFS